MTTSPDHPSPTPLPPTTEPAPPVDAPPATDSQPESTPQPESQPEPAGIDADVARTLDEGTYDRILEPRGAGRLALENGVWHQISRKYLAVQLIGSGFWLAVVIAATLVLVLVFHQPWALIPGIGLAVVILIGLAVLPRQVRATGYQLREDDLVFRRGILWQRMVAVPYGRMQLVDITHGPLDRGFGIAQLKFVTAAAATGVTIPGLTQQAAEALRDHLISVAESRRTGL